MRNFKRFLAMALTMLMVIGCVSMSAFAFVDYESGDYTEAVNKLTSIGVIYGVGDDKFDPDTNVSRWQAALFMSRLASGLTSAEEQNTVWYSEMNNTGFTDVAPHQYLGAIQYAANYGFIVGNGDGTFNPNGNITFQDFLTIAVRALGYDYGTAGYPWKFISQAVKLGLDDGLEAVSYTAALTRAQTAQLLYNLLYALNADGTCYADTVFGENSSGEYTHTVVVVATTTRSMFLYSMDGTLSNSHVFNDQGYTQAYLVDKTGYVAVRALKKNGQMDNSTTYFVKASDLGENVNVYDSFRIISNDDLATIEYSTKNASAFIEASMLEDTKDAKYQTTIILGDTTYKMVSAFSSLYNTQGNKTDVSEIMVYNANGHVERPTTENSFDANHNIFDKNGLIKYYYVPEITGSYAEPYAIINARGFYQAVTWAQIEADNDIVMYRSFYQPELCANVDAIAANTGIANMKDQFVRAYDDNGDGKYDRAYIYRFYFATGFDKDNNTGKTSENTDYIKVLGCTMTGAEGRGVANRLSVAEYVNLDTMESSTTLTLGGKPVVFTMDAALQTMYYKFVDATTTVTGLVTKLDFKNNIIAIDGVDYTVGDTTYAGIPSVGTFDAANYGSIFGKSVELTLWQNHVIDIYDGEDITYVAVDRVLGINDGYFTVYAMVYGESAKKVIQVATIDDLNYANLVYKYGALFTQFVATQVTDCLFSGYEDVNGYWHVYTTWNIAVDNANWFVDEDTVLTFGNNGIMNGVALDLGTELDFAATTSTVFVIWNGDEFVTFKGQPINATLTFNDGGVLAAKFTEKTIDKTNHKYNELSYVFAWNADFEGTYKNENGIHENVADYDDIVYIGGDAKLTTINDSNSVPTGNTYTINTWSNVYSVVSQTLVNVTANLYTDVQYGSFYKVVSGKITEEIVPGETDDLVIGFVGAASHSKAYVIVPYVDNNGNIDTSIAPDVVTVSGPVFATSLNGNAKVVVDDENKIVYSHICQIKADLADSNTADTIAAAIGYGASTFTSQAVIVYNGPLTTVKGAVLTMTAGEIAVEGTTTPATYTGYLDLTKAKNALDSSLAGFWFQDASLTDRAFLYESAAYGLAGTLGANSQVDVVLYNAANIASILGTSKANADKVIKGQNYSGWDLTVYVDLIDTTSLMLGTTDLHAAGYQVAYICVEIDAFGSVDGNFGVHEYFALYNPTGSATTYLTASDLVVNGAITLTGVQIPALGAKDLSTISGALLPAFNLNNGNPAQVPTVQ